MNALWAGMMLMAIIYGTFHGTIPAVTQAALDSAKEAVSLCITMVGVVALWMGLMEIASEAGLIQKLTNGISPFLNYLFPRIPKNHPARGYIATNIIANILGLGWACTPAGLKAMEELANLEAERGSRGFTESTKGEERCASDEMCHFLILNISSLQLIPVNMIAYRSQYGSREPTAIIAPAIIATLAGTLVAVAFCRISGRQRRKG